jgi:hypothetical protein
VRKQRRKTDNRTARQRQIFKQTGDIYDYRPYKNGHQSDYLVNLPAAAVAGGAPPALVLQQPVPLQQQQVPLQQAGPPPQAGQQQQQGHQLQAGPHPQAGPQPQAAQPQAGPVPGAVPQAAAAAAAAAAGPQLPAAARLDVGTKPKSKQPEPQVPEGPQPDRRHDPRRYDPDDRPLPALQKKPAAAAAADDDQDDRHFDTLDAAEQQEEIWDEIGRNLDDLFRRRAEEEGDPSYLLELEGMSEEIALIREEQREALRSAGSSTDRSSTSPRRR